MPRSLAISSLFAAGALALGACGGDSEPQDANEPEGDFPVEVTVEKFKTDQRLAETTDLVLGVENTGDEQVPELAFTITTTPDEGTPGSTGSSSSTGTGGADGSFNIRSDQPGLANPNRPVWVLENKYPRLADEPPPAGLSGAFRAQTNTFGFGPLQPGDEKEAVWRLTPVQAGSYTVRYLVSAGLDGDAKAVDGSGDPVEGEFEVEVSDVPPKARVNDAGQVVTK